MFLFFLLLTVLGMHYIALLWFFMNAGISLNIWLRLAPALASVVFLGALVLARRLDGPFGEWLGQIAYIWLGALFLLFVFVMVIMAVQYGLILLKINIPFKLGPAVLAIWFAICAFSVYAARKEPVFVYLNALPMNVSADKILLITDTHFGDSVSLARAQALVEQLNKQNPDIIFFTGDIFEIRGRGLDAFADVLAALNPKYGKYGVWGNHEYYGGLSRARELWQRAGIVPLENASANIAGINIVGVNDINATRMGRDAFVKIIQNSDTQKYTILLSHTPKYFNEAAANGVNLMLSGHTHDGQIWPFNLLARIPFRHTHGLYNVGKMQHYVSAGTFYWGPPMRFLTVNEVTVIGRPSKKQN